jgi:hypothetical protein
LKREQLVEFPVLQDFPLCRVETAQLLEHRNSTLPYRKACPTAVDSMISEFELATIMEVTEKFKHSVGFYLALNCRLTLLAHSVGYHRDTFSDNSGDKIENKVLLVNKDRSNVGNKIAMGRGGAGPGIFVYALLDW